MLSNSEVVHNDNSLKTLLKGCNLTFIDEKCCIREVKNRFAHVLYFQGRTTGWVVEWQKYCLFILDLRSSRPS